MYAPLTPLATQHDGGHLSPEILPMLDDREMSRVARTDASVLFTGPVHVRTLALKIHSLSGWRWGPFLWIDCASPESALEDQLFRLLEGDQSPAASSPTPRLLQPGTLFLHEVGRLSAGAQRRLRDLLERAASGMGPRSRRRIMASTTEPLLPRVSAGTFDDRLYYRLNVLHFVLPDALPSR